MNLLSAPSLASRLQTFDERTSAVGLTHQVCETHMHSIDEKISIITDTGLDYRRLQPRDHT